jgi:hypothetical protein
VFLIHQEHGIRRQLYDLLEAVLRQRALGKLCLQLLVGLFQHGGLFEHVSLNYHEFVPVGPGAFSYAG